MPEDQDEEISACPEEPEDQDAEASAYPEVDEMPKDQDAEASDHNEVPGIGARYCRNIHNTTDYLMKMDIDVKNIDKNDNKTWSAISEAIGAPYFEEMKTFPKLFLRQCKNHPNEPQNIPYEINRNIKITTLEESVYAQVVMIRRKIMAKKKKQGKTLKKLLVSRKVCKAEALG